MDHRKPTNAYVKKLPSSAELLGALKQITKFVNELPIWTGASNKRKQILKYFAAFPEWAVWPILLGVAILYEHIFGLLLIGIGLWAIIDWTKKPDDATFDAWLEDDLRTLQLKALSKTGTAPGELVGPPVMVTGPRFWNVADAKVLYKAGKDKQLRFTPIGVTVINFTENQLIAYACVLDFTTGKALNETTDEYFYRDIVSVSTKTKSQTVVVPGKEEPIQLNASEMFVLTTAGGNAFEVTLRDPSLIEMMGGGELPTNRAEKAILAIRKILRERKSATS